MTDMNHVASPAAAGKRGRRPPPDKATWEEARSRYIDGYAARHICLDLNICLSSFRKRAAREGWRRFDQPLAGWPKEWTGDDEAELPHDAFDLHAMPGVMPPEPWSVAIDWRRAHG